MPREAYRMETDVVQIIRDESRFVGFPQYGKIVAGINWTAEGMYKKCGNNLVIR